jgi:hypothetical protein
MQELSEHLNQKYIDYLKTTFTDFYPEEISEVDLNCEFSTGTVWDIKNGLILKISEKK